jgi:hypothetical protein
MTPTCAEIAMTDPTDRSMPPVPITSAMPTATMATGTAWRRGVLTKLSRLKPMVATEL